MKNVLIAFRIEEKESKQFKKLLRKDKNIKNPSQFFQKIIKRYIVASGEKLINLPVNNPKKK